MTKRSTASRQGGDETWIPCFPDRLVAQSAAMAGDGPRVDPRVQKGRKSLQEEGAHMGSLLSRPSSSLPFELFPEISQLEIHTFNISLL